MSQYINVYVPFNETPNNITLRYMSTTMTPQQAKHERETNRSARGEQDGVRGFSLWAGCARAGLEPKANRSPHVVARHYSFFHDYLEVTYPETLRCFSTSSLTVLL